MHETWDLHLKFYPLHKVLTGFLRPRYTYRWWMAPIEFAKLSYCREFAKIFIHLRDVRTWP